MGPEVVRYEPLGPVGAKMTGRLSPVSVPTAEQPLVDGSAAGSWGGPRAAVQRHCYSSYVSDPMKDWIAVAAAPRAHSSKGRGRVITSQCEAVPKADAAYASRMLSAKRS